VEAARAWVTPAAAVGALAKYLGVSSFWAAVIACLIPIVGEGLGFLLGRFLYRNGGVEAEYRMAMDKDPWKVATLKELRRLRRHQEAARRGDPPPAESDS
jgi:hypothetical protein